jgi:hypothetical protein
MDNRRMRIDEHILRAALTHPDAGTRHPGVDAFEQKKGVFRLPASWVPASAEFIAWARAHDIPEPLIDVFERGWPNATADISAWARLWSCDGIRHQADEYVQLRETGLLVLGSCLNGDWIAVDLRATPDAGTIGFLCRAELWNRAKPIGDETPPPLVDDIRAHFLPVACSLGGFVLAAVKDAVPLDSYGEWSEENDNGDWE